VQDIAAERGQFRNQDYWSVSKNGQTEICVATAGCVPACLQSGPKIDTVMWFRVYLYANCTFTSCLCVCLCGMGNRFTPFFCGSHFQN